MRTTRMSSERRRFWWFAIVTTLAIAFHTWLISLGVQFDGMTKDVIFYALVSLVPCAMAFAILHATFEHERRQAQRSGGKLPQD
jgi:drug/metabolite transporter (DMT)-like permease